MKRQAKLGLVFIAVAIGALIAFVGAEPDTMKTLEDVYANPSEFQGRTVSVKAMVLEGSVNLSAEPMHFKLAEGNLVLPVEWASVKPVPNHEAGGSLDGRTVVVDGEIVERDGNLVLLASDMKVGCASKYEPNATGEDANGTGAYEA